MSLQRRDPTAFGNDPINWKAAFPEGTSAPDTDGDGMADWWEVAHGLVVGVNDAALDPDGDGMSNLQEYLAQTDPHDSTSVLRLTAVHVDGQLLLGFEVQPDVAYTVQYSESLLPASWQTWHQVPPSPTRHQLWLTNPPSATQQIFFRIVTPPRTLTPQRVVIGYWLLRFMHVYKTSGLRHPPGAPASLPAYHSVPRPDARSSNAGSHHERSSWSASASRGAGRDAALPSHVPAMFGCTIAWLSAIGYWRSAIAVHGSHARLENVGAPPSPRERRHPCRLTAPVHRPRCTLFKRGVSPRTIVVECVGKQGCRGRDAALPSDVARCSDARSRGYRLSAIGIKENPLFSFPPFRASLSP